MDFISFFSSDIGRFGYGTSLLLQDRSAADAIRLLDTAIDQGIQYFDTARMYCSGHAEAIVGEVADRRRDRMFITTKAGIFPPSTKPVAKVARKLAGMTGLRVPRFARAPDHCFGPEQIRASVDTSLAALGTKRIDLLLMHEIAPVDVTDELIDLLHGLQSQGTIRAYGLATGRAETRAILAQFPGTFVFAQVPDSLWLRQRDAEGFDGVDVLASHSLLGPAFADLALRLKSDAALGVRWSERLDIDCRNTSALARLFLAEALDANRRGPVLFSSGNPQNIHANMALLRDPPDPQRLAQLRALVQEDSSSA